MSEEVKPEPEKKVTQRKRAVKALPSKLTFTERISEIQRTIKVPKSQTNKFGGFNYRNCEDILNALKPHLTDGLMLLMGEEIDEIGGRIYVKSIVSLSNGEESITSESFAREPEYRKGMDESQITGATTSYARKRALDALLCLDDHKDEIDARDPKDNEEKKQTGGKKPAKPNTTKVKAEPKKLLTSAQKKRLFDLVKEMNLGTEDIKKILADYGYKSSSDIEQKDFSAIEDAIMGLDQLPM